MIANRASVQLSDYCFNVCESLRVAIQEENINDLNESARTAFEDLERCTGFFSTLDFHA